MKTYNGAILDESGFILFYVGVDAASRQEAYNKIMEIYRGWVEYTGNPNIRWDMEERQ